MRGFLTRAAVAVAAGSWLGVGTAAAQDITAYQADVGVATERDFEDYTRRILNRERYEILRFENGAQGFVETDWKIRTPFDDEVAQGVLAARSRILLRTRPRGSNITANTLRVQRIQFMVENLVRLEEGGDWVTMEPTKEMKDFAKDLGKRFEREFRSAMRRWE